MVSVELIPQNEDQKLPKKLKYTIFQKENESLKKIQAFIPAGIPENHSLPQISKFSLEQKGCACYGESAYYECAYYEWTQ